MTTGFTSEGSEFFWETRHAFADRAADVAQLVERVLGKDEVTGSIPVIGSRNFLEAGVTQW